MRYPRVSLMPVARWIKLTLGVALVGGVTVFAVRDPAPEPVEVIVSEVRKAEVVRKIRAAGHVEPVTQVRVSANVSGDLLSLEVKEGDTVVKGAMLAQIDRDRLEAVARQASASTRSAEATVRIESRQLEQARNDLTRATDLQAKGLTPAAELDRARSRVQVSEARVEGARQRVEQARATLDEAKARLQQTTIHAPIDGTVIRLMKKVGERIRGSDLAEDVLLVLAPLHAMEVEVEVGEQEVINVEIGQRAEIGVDALGDDHLPGRVVEIASSATIRFRGEERETTSFRVKVALEEIPARLRSGMSASVAVVTSTRTNAIAVPIEAVTARLPSELKVRAEDRKRRSKRRKGGKDDKENRAVIRRREKPQRIVFTVHPEGDHHRVEPTKVVTGISSETDFEILSGLEEGTEIVVGPYRALAKELLPGSPIKIVDRLRFSPDPAAKPKIAADAAR